MVRRKGSWRGEGGKALARMAHDSQTTTTKTLQFPSSPTKPLLNLLAYYMELRALNFDRSVVLFYSFICSCAIQLHIRSIYLYNKHSKVYTMERSCSREVGVVGCKDDSWKRNQMEVGRRVNVRKKESHQCYQRKSGKRVVDRWAGADRELWNSKTMSELE